MGFPAIGPHARGKLFLAAALVIAIAFAFACVPGPADAKPGHGKPKRHRVDLTGATKKVAGDLPGPIEDQGTVTGKPFRNGKVKLFVTLDLASSHGRLEVDSGWLATARCKPLGAAITQAYRNAYRKQDRS